MKPLTPTPCLVVDTWGFRLVDPDCNYVGKQDGILVTDNAGQPALMQMPGIERTVQTTDLGD